MATISTQCGGPMVRDHNRRKKDVVSKEEHIHKEGEHYIDVYGNERIAHSETIVDMTPLQAYKQIFGQAIEDYNEKQIRNRHHDRCTSVSEYLKEIQQHEHKKPIYEMIIGVYGKDVPHEQQEEIVREFISTWEERNPNLILVGVYLHDDENGGLHGHIDYVPIYHCERGLGIKQGLNKALEEQGVELPSECKGPHDKYHTRQIAWTKSQNEYLEQLCSERGIEVEHPQRESGFTREHEEKRDYIARQQARENRELKEELQELQASATSIIESQNQTIARMSSEKSELIKVANEKIHKANEIISQERKAKEEYKTLYQETYKEYKREYEENHKFDKYNGENEWASDWDLQR